MAVVGDVSFVLALLDSSNKNLLDADMQSWTATFTRKALLEIAATTSPTAWTVNNLTGSSPVTAVIMNTAASDATILGVAGFTQTVRAGKCVLIDQLNTTSQLTVSLASGTGTIKVLLLD